MFRFLLTKIFQSILIIWGITTLLYGVFYLLEDPVNYMVGEQADEKTKEKIRIKYGLDKPMTTQYFHYLHQLSPIGQKEDSTWGVKAPDMGISYQNEVKVRELIGQHLTGSAVLTLFALGFAAVIGISLGIVAALYHNTIYDKLIIGVSVLGISAPSFFVGIIFIWLFAVVFRNITGLDAGGYLFDVHPFTGERIYVWKNLWLPMLALGIRPLAVFVQLTKSAMLDIMQMDYIRTAYAKGLSHFIVIVRHTLRNALSPVLTAVTGWLASLLAGAFFIEYIFNWKGIGKLTIDALTNHDFPIILGCCITVGTIFVVVNVLTDILYAVLDPRVKI